MFQGTDLVKILKSMAKAQSCVPDSCRMDFNGTTVRLLYVGMAGRSEMAYWDTAIPSTSSPFQVSFDPAKMIKAIEYLKGGFGVAVEDGKLTMISMTRNISITANTKLDTPVENVLKTFADAMIPHPIQIPKKDENCKILRDAGGDIIMTEEAVEPMGFAVDGGFWDTVLKAKKYASSDVSRQVLCETMIVDGHIYGTDGCRLYVNRERLMGDGSFSGNVIPPVLHIEPSRLKKLVYVNNAQFLIGDGFVHTSTNYILPVPNVHQVIPEAEGPHRVQLEKCADFLKLAGKADRRAKSVPIVTIKSDGSGIADLNIRNPVEDDDYSTQIKGAVLSDFEFEMRFDAHYLIDAMKDGFTLMVVDDESKPAFLRRTDGNGKEFMLLMPVRK